MQHVKDETFSQSPSLGERKNTEIKEHKVHCAITTLRPAAEVYMFWKRLENFPKFMNEVEDIVRLTDTKSRWKLELRPGVKVEWEAEIVEDVPDRLIAWKTTGRSNVTTDGRVKFYPSVNGRGTVIEVLLDYSIPGGKFAELAAKIWGEDPYAIVHKNLNRFKAYLETGEVPTTEGQTSGREKDAKVLKTH